MKTYIIAEDVYMFEQACMKEVQLEGGLRELLLHLLYPDGVENDEDGFEVGEPPRKVHSANELTTEELQKWFDDANGDGQPYVQVWCVEDRKQVLG